MVLRGMEPACGSRGSRHALRVRTGLQATAVASLLLIACRPDLANDGATPVEQAPAPEAVEPPASDRPVDPPGTFEGREIADTMSYLGAGWLTRPERDAEENTTLMHEQLGLEPGDVACDVGAGNGYHSLKMAAAVGPKGKVIASDLQPEMLELLEVRAKETGVSNLQTVQATDREEYGKEFLKYVKQIHDGPKYNWCSAKACYGQTLIATGGDGEAEACAQASCYKGTETVDVFNENPFRCYQYNFPATVFDIHRNKQTLADFF